ncbi:MAG: hypothetical protein KGJ13_11860 [Patescibacteria group bacterium]|nr:hypothetical protein [Patescibacteria group bacterium]
MRYSVQINDGFTKSISAATFGALLSALAEYHGTEEDELTVDETDEGDLILFRGGPPIGLVEVQPHWPATTEFEMRGAL